MKAVKESKAGGTAAVAGTAEACDVPTGKQKRSEGNHTESLRTNAARVKAASEQSELQGDPNALPAVGYPNLKDASSPVTSPQEATQASRTRK